MSGHCIVRRHANGGWQVVCDGVVIATLDSSSEATARAEREMARERAWASMWSTPFDFSKEPR